ncbi:MAG: hypothetical protein RIQ54_302 [Candidatus Parcubacteria bacterium]
MVGAGAVGEVQCRECTVAGGGDVGTGNIGERGIGTVECRECTVAGGGDVGARGRCEC